MESIKNNKKEIILIVILIIYAIFISFQLYLNPISKVKGFVNADMQVFLNIGKGMHDGQIPYRDIFDHKGPLLYLINYIGTSFNNTICLWTIEVFFMIISTIFIYKTSKLIIKNNKLSAFVAMLIITTISIFIQDGNYTEEFALPFILISLYLYIKSYMNNTNSIQISNKTSIIVGICCGAVLALRVNMVVLWLVYSLCIFFELIVKDKKSLFNYIIYFAIGNLIVIIPFIIYLTINGAFKDFFYQYIIFNFKYSSLNNNYLGTLIFFVLTSPIIIYSAFLFLVESKYTKLRLINLIYLAITLLIVVIPANKFHHYGIILLPTFIFPICSFFNICYDYKYLNFIVCIISIIFIFNDIRFTISTLGYVNFSGSSNKMEAEIIEYLNKEKNSKDKMLVLGNYTKYYYCTRLKPCSKYIYQFPIGYVDNQIFFDVVEDIKREKPRFIVHDKFFNITEEDRTVEFMFIYDEYEKVFENGICNIYEIMN